MGLNSHGSSGDTCFKGGTVLDLGYLFGKVTETAKKSQGKLRQSLDFP
jgi:hypothetical protein